MLLGSERLLASSRLKGLRVGVLANPASVDGQFRHIVDHLAASCAPGDVVVTLSNGSFGGIWDQLLARLGRGRS